MQVFICTNVGGAVVAAATVSVTVSSLFTIFGASFAGVGVGVNGPTEPTGDGIDCCLR
jgi:hypothetical protein